MGHVKEKARGFIVLGIEAEPGDHFVLSEQPLAPRHREGSLAESGTRLDDRERLAAHLFQAFEEAGSCDLPALRPGQHDLCHEHGR